MTSMISIKAEDPNTPDALALMEELSESLQLITGDSGRNSFDLKDVCVPRSMFIIARNLDGEAIGCGAIRPIDKYTAEVKRMYTRTKGQGVGIQILSYLEKQAKELDYSVIWLETRLVNQRAVSFYESRRYQRIPNYGKYINNTEAVCFEKKLATE
jgi:GNAT superfamily N-acetyltransferase